MEEGFELYALLLLALSIATILLIQTILPNRRCLPPGPPALPLIGHLHLIRQPVHQSLHKLAARYGPLVSLRLGSTPCIVASSPDLARELLKTHDAAFCDRPQSAASRHFAYDSAGFAFAPYGPYWRFMKKLCMSQLLGGPTVNALQPIRHGELLALLRTFQAKSQSGEAVDLSWELIKMSNNGITRMVASTTSSDAEEARVLVKQLSELVGAFNLSDFIRACRNLDLQGLNKRIREVHRRFDALMERIIEGKEEARRRRKEVEGGDDGVKDMLDILLDVSEDENAEMKLSRENIKGFVLDILAAGSDSTAAIIEWALAELIKHPTILQKAREEIDGAVEKGRLVEEGDIPKLPYLQSVVKETMRLHPASPLIHRQSTKDTRIGGYDIPAKTSLLVNLWSIGRDPAHWEDPLEFRPDRFMARREEAIDVRGQHFQLLPFGSGRRGCPGILLGLQVVHATLAAMVQCFEWEVVDAGGRGGGETTGMTADMEEGVGLVIARAHPLVCVPIARFDPFPSIQP